MLLLLFLFHYGAHRRAAGWELAAPQAKADCLLLLPCSYGNHVPAEVMEALGPVIWRRITGQLYIPSKHHCRLVSGCIADHRWFLGALAAVSCKRELLLDLFVSDEMSLRGLYTLRFFKHGKWCPVVVDNRLPCMELQQQLAFCSSGQAQVRRTCF